MNDPRKETVVGQATARHDRSDGQSDLDSSPAPGFWPSFIVLAFSLTLLSPLLLFPFARDHGVYAVIAEAMSDGLMPYRDVWDIKTPGIFYIFQVALALFGRNMWGIRILELLVQVCTVFCLYRLGCRLLNDRIAAFAGAFYAVLLKLHALNWWHTAQAESFLSLPFLGFLLSLAGIRSGTRASTVLLRYGFAGVCLGTVFVLKFPNILSAVCILPLIPLLGRRTVSRSGSPSALFTSVGVFCLGLILVPGAVALHFIVTGAWHALWETLFIFAPRYAGITISGGLLSHGLSVLGGYFFSGGTRGIRILCLAGLILSLFRLKKTGRSVLLLWFLASYTVIWIQAKFFLYHFLPLYLPCALLAGLATGAISQGTASRFKIDPASRPKVRLALAALLILLPAALEGVFIHKHLSTTVRLASGAIPRDIYLGQFRDGTDFSLTADMEISAHLESMTRPDEKIFIWGFEPLVYFLSQRRPASRFITHQPVASRWQMAGWRDELMDDLASTQPTYFLVLRNDSMPAVTGFDQDSLGLLIRFPALGKLLDREYELEGDMEDFMIYRRTASNGADF